MVMSDQVNWMSEEFSKVGLTISRDKAEKLFRYYEILVEKNKVMNLTAITDYEEVVRKHFADSLIISKYLDFHNIHRIIDIGTGAGFPGLVLKIVFPEVSVTLLDSLAKRIRFLQSAAEELKLGNINFVHARTEDAAVQACYREQYDLAVSRAVAQLNILSEYCLPYVKIGGMFVSYKGGDVTEELEASKKAFQLLGGHLKKVESFRLYDMQRSLIFVDKTSVSPKKYPRKAGMPSRNPL